MWPDLKLLNPIAFQVHADMTQVPLDLIPFHRWAFPDGTLWTSFYRVENGYLLRFPDLADFTVSNSGLEVVSYAVAGVSRQTVEHLYLNQVLPLALSRQFKLILHASAVEIENFAVAFLGMSGRGKSTLATSFATSGHRFLTDDGLQLEKADHGYIIQPSHPSIRLWDDSRLALMPETAQAAPPVDFTPKSRFLADNEVAYCDAARPLRCLYFLGEGDTNTISIEPVSGRDAMIELIKHSFLLDIEEREMLMHHFGQLTDLARIPMFFRLDYPREYEMLPQVRDVVIRHSALLK